MDDIITNALLKNLFPNYVSDEEIKEDHIYGEILEEQILEAEEMKEFAPFNN